MRFIEMIFALVEKGYRLEFERRLFVHSERPVVEVVVYNEEGELVSSIHACDEDELAAFLANTWRIEG